MKEAPAAQRVLSWPGFAVVLAAAIFACFPQVLLGRESFYFRDYGVLGYPVIHFFRESFQAHAIPLWNPLSNCGVPFFAQWGAMCAYPFSLIFLLLPLPWSLSLFCFVHLWIGGMGMWFLARHWTENNVAAAVSGAAYVFSGVMFASFIWPNYFVALGWMPVVVHLAGRAAREGGRWIAGAAMASALQLGSGVPEIILFTWVIVGILFLCDYSEVAGNGGRLLARLVVVILLAAGLMAVQLLPFFDLLTHSQRQAPFTGAKWSLPVWAVANFVAPLLNCFETPQGQFFQYGQEFLSSVYLGLPVVVLAIVGALKYPVARTWALLLLSVVAILLALGDNTPLFPALRRVLPLAAIARYPVKFMFVPAFIFPLLAALAVRAAHVEGRVAVRSIVYLTLLAAAVVAGFVWAAHEGMLVDMAGWPRNFRLNTEMSWSIAALNAGVRVLVLVVFVILLLSSARATSGGCLAAVAAVGLLAIDGRTHAPHQNPTLPAAEFQPGAWSPESGPAAVAGEGRIFITAKSEEVLLNVTSTNSARLWRAKRASEWSNLNLLDGIPKVNGSATLQVGSEAKFQAALYALTNVPPSVLDFLGVCWVSAGELGKWTRRDTALPWVTAGQSIVFADTDHARAIVLSNRFDPRKVVVLPVEARQAAVGTNGAVISSLSSSVRTHTIDIDLDAAEPAPVVISQSYYHHWRATIDGRDAPLYLANSAFQAVLVSSGRHHVRVEYHDTTLRAGAAVSGVSLLVWLMVLCLPVWRVGKGG